MAETANDFDGCHRACRKAGAHTLTWGGCEFAPEPPAPTPVLPVVFIAADGHRSLRYEPITWDQAAAMLHPNTDAAKLLRADERAKVRAQLLALAEGFFAAHNDMAYATPEKVLRWAADRIAPEPPKEQ